MIPEWSQNHLRMFPSAAAAAAETRSACKASRSPDGWPKANWGRRVRPVRLLGLPLAAVAAAAAVDKRTDQPTAQPTAWPTSLTMPLYCVRCVDRFLPHPRCLLELLLQRSCPLRLFLTCVLPWLRSSLGCAQLRLVKAVLDLFCAHAAKALERLPCVWRLRWAPRGTPWLRRRAP